MEKEYIERDKLLKWLNKNKSACIEVCKGLNNNIEKHAAEEAIAAYDDCIGYAESMPAADVATVVHGEWVLEVHDEGVNYRWHVTAECSECCNEKKEIWAGFFPDVPDHIAKFISLQEAERVKLSNYCPNCSAKMDGGKHETD